MLVDASVFETNAVRVRADGGDVDVNLRLNTGAFEIGTPLGYHVPIWRINDGPGEPKALGSRKVKSRLEFKSTSALCHSVRHPVGPVPVRPAALPRGRRKGFSCVLAYRSAVRQHLVHRPRLDLQPHHSPAARSAHTTHWHYGYGARLIHSIRALASGNGVVCAEFAAECWLAASVDRARRHHWAALSRSSGDVS